MSMDIDDKYIDVDFPKQTPYVFGNCDRPAFSSRLLTTFEDFVQLIPSSQWPELVEQIAANNAWLARLIKRLLNQRQEGSCVGFATTQGVRIVIAKQHGEDAVTELSPISLYKQIGRSPSSGSTLDDAWEAVRNVGILPLDTPENRQRFGNAVMPETGFYTAWPENWRETAKLFRATEGHIIRSIEGLVTALLLGYPVIVGRQGHSIVYTDIVYRNGQMYAAYCNSWGDWGAAFGDMSTGFGFDSMGLIRQSAAWAFCIRSVTVPTR